MKQLTFFSDQDNFLQKQDIWTLFIDGASRGNPGPSGAGVFILKNNVPFYEEGFFLGKKTNNQAEYLALLVGLFLIEQYSNKKDLLHIISDSQLLIRQLQGIYRVRHNLLIPLFTIAQKLLSSRGSVTFRHVLRELNIKADAMANKGIETGNLLPQPFIELLKHYEVTF